MKAEQIERQFAAGETLFESGSPAAEAYLVRSGSVRLRAPAPAGDERIGPGQLLGVVELVLAQPHGYTATADSEVEAIALELPLLNRLCSENPEFSMRLVQQLAERIARLEALGLPAAGSPGRGPRGPSRKDALRRVCEAILSHAEDGEGPPAVRSDLRGIADAACLSLSETYFEIQALLDDRVLRLGEDHLTLSDPERLSDLMRNPPD